jgi:tetratricopeptide (TPR) repeat protein
MLASSSRMSAPFEAKPPSGPQSLRLEISDGQGLALHQWAVHWQIARMLLDFVVPKGHERAAPEHDSMVREWYRATAAWMQLREDHAEDHLARALKIFPDDPDLLFLAGCQRETFAGAAIQAAVRSAVLPGGVTIGVYSPQAELRDAEQFFRRALQVKPDHVEARLRFGRVLGNLGKHAEAATELSRAVAELTDDEQLYFAELFLGAEQEALGNRELARVSYEQAAARYPVAQSPLIALSQLAWRTGDRNGALKAMDRVFALAGEERDDNDDPWWDYYVVQARNADDLLEALRQPYLAERLQ